MDATKCQELSSDIIELVGGRENVEHVLHCTTRLRFNLRDYDKADIAAIRKLDVVPAGAGTAPDHHWYRGYPGL